MSAATPYTPAGYCPHCGYAVSPGACPECGRSVLKPRERPPWSRKTKVSLWAVAGVLLLSAGGLSWRFRSELCGAVWPGWHLQELARGNGPWQDWAWWTLHQRTQSGASARLQKIEQELSEAPRNDWAGRYAAHDCMSTLFVASRSGFYFADDGCGGATLNHGQVLRLDSNELILAPVLDPNYAAGPQRRYVPVRWMGRRHLIPPGDIPDFANEVNLGNLEATLDYLSRIDETAFDPAAPLQAPELWKRYFLDAPASWIVASAEPFDDEMSWGQCFQLYRAVLVGDDPAQATVGMELCGLWPDADVSARITAVERRSLLAEVRVAITEIGTHREVQPGQVLCSFNPRNCDAAAVERVQGQLRERNVKWRGRQAQATAGSQP